MPQPSQDIGTGAYVSGRPHIAVWSLVSGHPRCVDAPLPIAGTPPAALAAAIACNRALSTLCANAETLEVAQRRVEQDEPPELVDMLNDQGQLVQTANPDHTVWTEAAALVAAASSDSTLQHLLRTRSDSLERDAFGYPAEAPFEFVLPPVPAIANPLAQTAEWDGQTWHVRGLTEAELADWPLRPAPTLGKSAFAQVLRGAVGDVLAITVLTAPEINLTLTLAGQVDWMDIFVAANGGPGYAQRLIDAGIVTGADVAALKDAWPLFAGD